MGFNNNNKGSIHLCWMENGVLYEEAACSKQVRSYPTKLDISLPKQKNLFVSNTVAFLLYDEDKMYIGRFDGVISIYDKNSRLLLGISAWSPPEGVPLKLIGFFHTAAGIKEVNLDLRDHQTVYIDWHRIEALLSKPFNITITDTFTALDRCYTPTLSTWYFFDKEGNKVGLSVWDIQNSLWKQDCEIFL